MDRMTLQELVRRVEDYHRAKDDSAHAETALEVAMAHRVEAKERMLECPGMPGYDRGTIAYDAAMAERRFDEAVAIATFYASKVPGTTPDTFDMHTVPLWRDRRRMAMQLADRSDADADDKREG